MRITRITNDDYPDTMIIEVIFDTDRLKRRAKDINKRIEETNAVVDRKIDRASKRICDIFG